MRDIARTLARQGHEVVVIGEYPREEAGIRIDAGVRVVRLPAFSNGRLGFLRARMAIGNWVKGKAPFDIVEAPAGGGWSLFVPPTVPVVVRLHSSVRFGERMGWRGRRGLLLRLTEDLAIRRATGLVAVSRWVARRAPLDYPYARLRRRGIKVIHNGVDLDLFRPRPWAERIPGCIVFAGTIKPQKGIVTLLRAFSLVAAQVPDARLLVVGRDTSIGGRSYWSTAVREAGLHTGVLARITRMDPVPRQELAALYGFASVCVFPSLAESFGLVAAEAMACARPVVYSSTTAGPEVIRDGKDGLLADPESPEEFAAAILRVLCNHEFAAKLAQEAAKSAEEKFSIERCAAQTLNYYRKLTESPGRKQTR